MTRGEAPVSDLAGIAPEALAAALGGGAPIEAAVVLGSGQSGVLAMDDVREVPYGDIPGFPRTGSLVGHAGRLRIGTAGGKRVAAFAGRLHMYQGVSAYDAAFPTRLASAMGARSLIVSNAAGGLVERLRAGDLVLLSDHINLLSASPLTGWDGGDRGEPFVPMRDAYDPELRALAHERAKALGIALAEGVYAAVRGPAYETPAEVAMLRTIGADLVGMSTVPEVIAARALDLRVLGISLVTNAAAGEHLSHTEVLATGERAAGEMGRLIAAILERL